MALNWNTATYRYLDSGTLYLTDEQQASQYLQVRLQVLEYSPPISESYLRNPPQTVFGYSTLVSNGCVFKEVQQRYAYQVVAEFYEDTTAIQQTACEYFRTTNDNNFGAFNAIPLIGPFVFGNVAGIFPTLYFPCDSIRYVGAQEQVFEFQVFWIPIGGEEPCLPSKEKPPEPAAPAATAPNRNTSASPALPDPPGQESTPDDPDRTTPPSNALPGDFGPRNDSFPVCNTYFVRIDGVGSNDGVPGGRVDVVNYQNPCGPNPPPYTLVPDSPPSGVSPITGTYFFYQLIASNGVQCNVWNTGWLEGPVIGSVTCAS